MKNILTFNIAGTPELYREVIEIITGDKRESMIDLGCCEAPTTSKLGFKERVYVDVQKWEKHPEPENFVLANVLEYDPKRRFDVAYATDFLEHLTTQQGFYLIDQMIKWSDKQILFTPITDFFGLEGITNNNPDHHRSVWTPNQFNDEWIGILFPNFHPQWNGNGWFIVRCENIEEEFNRLKKELKYD